MHVILPPGRLRAPCNGLPEALDPIGQRMRTPAERCVHRRFVSAQRWSLEMTPLVRGVLGEVRAQARHSAGEVAQVYAARGLAHLARTGFFNPVHVKSLRADALRSLIIARKKLVGHYDFVHRAGRTPGARSPVVRWEAINECTQQ